MMRRWNMLLPLLLAAVTGCAGWKERLLPPTLSAQRENRAAETLQDFEQRRDAAQLAAALDRYKYGEGAKAEAMLTAIVTRRPDRWDARLRLGEILWSRGDAAAAEPHFRAVIAAENDRAEAHHALGLLLDATGRSDEAREHFAHAARLEPDNEVFRLTQESLVVR